MDEEVEQGLIALQAQADAVMALQDKIMQDLQAASDGELSCTHHSRSPQPMIYFSSM